MLKPNEHTQYELDVTEEARKEYEKLIKGKTFKTREEFLEAIGAIDDICTLWPAYVQTAAFTESIIWDNYTLEPLQNLFHHINDKKAYDRAIEMADLLKELHGRMIGYIHDQYFVEKALMEDDVTIEDLES